MKKLILTLTVLISSIQGFAQYNELQRINLNALPIIAEDFMPDQIELGISSNGQFNYFHGVLETPSGLFGELGWLEGELGFTPSGPGDTRTVAFAGYKWGTESTQMDFSVGIETDIEGHLLFGDLAGALRLGAHQILFSTKTNHMSQNFHFSMNLNFNVIATTSGNFYALAGLSSKLSL